MSSKTLVESSNTALHWRRNSAIYRGKDEDSKSRCSPRSKSPSFVNARLCEMNCSTGIPVSDVFTTKGIYKSASGTVGGDCGLWVTRWTTTSSDDR